MKIVKCLVSLGADLNHHNIVSDNPRERQPASLESFLSLVTVVTADLRNRLQLGGSHCLLAVPYRSQAGENVLHALLGNVCLTHQEPLACLEFLVQKCSEDRLNEEGGPDGLTPLRLLARSCTGQYAVEAFRCVADKLDFSMDSDEPDKVRHACVEGSAPPPYSQRVRRWFPPAAASSDESRLPQRLAFCGGGTDDIASGRAARCCSTVAGFGTLSRALASRSTSSTPGVATTRWRSRPNTRASATKTRHEAPPSPLSAAPLNLAS